MAKHIREFDAWLDEHDWPRVACPTCGDGGLGVENLSGCRDAPSAKLVAKYDVTGPEELTGTFSGHLRCDNPSCDELVTVAGDWQLVVNEGDPKWGSFGDIYRIRYVNPPLQMMALPSATPASVRNAIEVASSVLWNSPASSAGRLRQGVEELLTVRGIKRFVVNKHGKQQRLALDSRIAIFGKTHSEVAETLLAVKWIGNNGAHDNTLTIDQVLVGAEILEAAIRALYDKTEAQLKSKVKAINKAKGLPKSKS